MSKKRILIIFVLIAVAAGALCLAACTPQKDADKIADAITKAKTRIAEYNQTNAAFADTLMYYLPNSCVYDDAGGFLIHYKNKNYLYNQNLTESTLQYVFFNTVADVASTAVGTTIYTLGYGKKFDGGCARYTVGDAATSEIYLENNGVFLNYATACGKVNLRQMGWSGGDIVGFQKQFEGFSQINTLVFTRGEYPMHDVVRTDRDNVNYFGIDATIYSADNFGGNTNKTYDALWSVRKTWSSTKTIVGQTYSGLDFEMRQKSYNAQIEGAKGLSYLMQLAYCKDIHIFNCNFLVPQGLYDGDLKKYATHCVDCYTSWENVTFDGCSFENYSYANAGGAIGFRDIYNLGCENLVFTNNTVVSSVRDECVAIFAGLDKRFHPEGAPLGNGYIRNCLLENNTFKALDTAEGLDPRTMFLTVGYQLSPVFDIKYLNNTFDGYCNSYFLHYCYCHGLTFKGNTVNIRQTVGSNKRLTLIYHNDSPEASNIVVQNNVFNLLGENFQLYSGIIVSPYSDAGEITFTGNTVNLPEGEAETLIAGNATVQNNEFNMRSVGSIFYRTCGQLGGNTYNVGTLKKSVFEFYKADVQRDLVVQNEKISVDVAKCNMLMFNGSPIKFNGHSLLFQNVQFDVKKVERDYYYIAYSSSGITDTVVPITFIDCSFGAYQGHLQIPNGEKHILKIETSANN